MNPGPATVSRGRYARTQALADTILDVVNVSFAEMSLSTRQIYYQCVSRAALPNSTSSYNKVQRLVVDLRREGEIEYDRIVDRTRAMHKRAGWDSPLEVMSAVGKQYRRDLGGLLEQGPTAGRVIGAARDGAYWRCTREAWEAARARGPARSGTAVASNEVDALLKNAGLRPSARGHR
jgi:hypothetical protein